MRQLWIVRLNAACRPLGLPYCRFIAGLKVAHIQMDRKSLSEMAIHDPEAFRLIVTRVQEAQSTSQA
jgi:large subunit ribosomal protein L20